MLMDFHFVSLLASHFSDFFKQKLQWLQEIPKKSSREALMQLLADLNQSESHHNFNKF